MGVAIIMLLSFINANGETFPVSGNYALKTWWGFGDLPADIKTTKAPYQDGETHVDSVIEAKPFGFDFTIIGSNRQEIFDRRLIVARHFNTKLGPGTLEWEQEDGTKYHINCIAKATFPSGEAQSRTHQIVIIDLYAPSPFWYDPTQWEQLMIGFSGGWSYPWSYPKNYGQVGTQIEIINLGNIETPVLIYFYGEVVNPVIQNLTTEKEISVVKTIPDGDILIINTAFGEKGAMILCGGEYVNAFEYVDPDSDFWGLAPGLNTLKYTVASEGTNANCRLYYYHRFSGV